MRRELTLILLLCIKISVIGQLTPLSDQYHWNTLSINPAYAGSQDALSITLLHRNQWTGFDGSPKTLTLSMHSPTRQGNIGFGAMLINDRIGVNNTYTASGIFAYRIQTETGILSLGLGGNLSFLKNSWDELIAIDPDDELLMNDNKTYIIPNFSIGSYYYTRKLFVGVSIPMFLSNEFSENTNQFNPVNDYGEYNYFLNGGYLFTLTSQWKILPSLMVRYKPGNNPQVDVNAYVIFNDFIWAGISYRSNQSLIGLLLLQINKQFAAGYSYNFELGPTGSYMSGSHEIMLRYSFRYIIDVISPRYF